MYGNIVDIETLNDIVIKSVFKYSREFNEALCQ